MNKFIRSTITLIIFTSLLGPAVKLPLNLPPVNVYLPDFFVLILIFLLILNYRLTAGLIMRDKAVKIFIFFAVYSLLTLIISPIKLTGFEFFVALSYLLRYVSYISLYLGCLLILHEKNAGQNISNYLNLAGIMFIILGWLQYWLYPDLRNLEYLGWDPHYKRIFALIFDPNYLGLILVLGFLLRHSTRKINSKEIIIQIIFLITVLFTYSRSSYLALISALIFYAWKIKKVVPYLSVSIILLISLLYLPRPAGAGVRLERLFSIKERLTNWQSAGLIIIRHPVSGVGFNSLRFARKNIGSLPENWLTGHSAAGVDNSFLFVAATTGLTGVIIFLFFLANLFNQSDLTGKTALIAVSIHSLFLNSLLFNFILIWLWLILALSKKEN